MQLQVIEKITTPLFTNSWTLSRNKKGECCIPFLNVHIAYLCYIAFFLNLIQHNKNTQVLIPFTGIQHKELRILFLYLFFLDKPSRFNILYSDLEIVPLA